MPKLICNADYFVLFQSHDDIRICMDSKSWIMRRFVLYRFTNSHLHSQRPFFCILSFKWIIFGSNFGKSKEILWLDWTLYFAKKKLYESGPSVFILFFAQSTLSDQLAFRTFLCHHMRPFCTAGFHCWSRRKRGITLLQVSTHSNMQQWNW